MGKIKQRKKKAVYLIRGFVVFEKYGREKTCEISILFISDKKYVHKTKEIEKAMVLFNNKAKDFVNQNTGYETNFQLKRVMLFKRLGYVSSPSPLDYIIDGKLEVI